VDRSSHGTIRSGFAWDIASSNDFRGAKPRYVCMRRKALVFPTGCRAGQTASTTHPAFLRASERRTGANQREVAATRTVGFTGLLRCNRHTKGAVLLSSGTRSITTEVAEKTPLTEKVRTLSSGLTPPTETSAPCQEKTFPSAIPVCFD